MQEIKKGWEKVKLGDLYNFNSGISKGRQYFGSGYPFLSYKEIFNNFFVPKKLDNLVQSSDKERVSCSIRRGDVFLTRTSETIDEIGMSSVSLLDYENATFNGFTKRLRPKYDNVIFPEYAGYYFRSFVFRDIISNMCSLITRASLNNDILNRLTIIYPDIEIQKKIANFLKKYDDLIENNNKRIKILEETVGEIYEEWFVKYNFPGSENIKMIDSGNDDFGMIPEGWVVKKVGDIINIPKGKNITKATVKEGIVPVVAGGLSPSCYHNISNTIGPVITISASGANAGYVNFYYEDIWASDCSYIDLNVTKYVYYWYLFFKNKQIELTGLQRGAAQPHVYPKDIMWLFTLDIPNNILQNFDSIVSNIFLEIGNLRKQNKNLKETRDLLISRLVSGELDVESLDVNI